MDKAKELSRIELIALERGEFDYSAQADFVVMRYEKDGDKFIRRFSEHYEAEDLVKKLNADLITAGLNNEYEYRLHVYHNGKLGSVIYIVDYMLVGELHNKEELCNDV